MTAMAEVQRRALEEAFGASSSSDDDDGEGGYGDGDDHRTLGRERKLAEIIPVWESSCEVNGLWLCREFLSEIEQQWLLSSIHQEGWFNGGSFNQAMRFGEIPEWARELAGFVREVVCFSAVEDQPLPSDLLWREPLFDQLIVNVYEPGHLCSCGLDAL